VLPEVDLPEHRKSRGAFFTPPTVARYVAEWAIRGPDDLILEPSCGEAAFLLAGAERLHALRGGGARPGQLTGVELHEGSARAAEGVLAAVDAPARIVTSDFFNFPARACYDAVVGNPPYVRYQAFMGEARTASQEAALAQGVRLSGLASSWAAFTVHAALFLKPGGRLGLVLPAELLSVNYAAQVRWFLMRRFGKVRLVLFNERVFPGVQEEVVLLLAEGEGPTDHCELLQLNDAAELVRLDHISHAWTPPTGGGKWTPALLTTEALEAYHALENHVAFETLSSWGRVSLGAVTGNNKFFAVPESRVCELRLTASDVIPLSPPGSRHLRAATLTQATWHQLVSDDQPAWLFRPAKPSRAARAYIAAGEAAGVNEAYKCRIRDPWWRVPLSPPADILLTYMNAGAVQLASNRAGLAHLNSVHGLVLTDDRRQLGMDLLPLASLNSMTLLGSELVGRSYGGGMLKLEPREAMRLPVPSDVVLRGEAGRTLRRQRPQLMRLLRSGQLERVVDLVDEALLVPQSGMSLVTVAKLAEARRVLVARRSARRRASVD
jgi:adenine-specific DNA-methyltransferase